MVSPQAVPATRQPSVAGLSLSVTNRRRWGVVFLLFIASLINYLDRATLSIAVPLIGKEMHLGPVEKGLLLSTFFWSYALMQLPIGWCADRFNLKWVYTGAFALWSMAQGMAGMSWNLLSLIFTRFVLGVGESIYLPGGTKVVSLLFKAEERGLPSGFFDFGTRIGMAVGGLTVPWLLVHYGWRHTFMLVGFPALLWLLPWVLVCPPWLQAGKKPEPSALSSAQSAPGTFRRGSMTWNRDLLGICLGFFCFDYYWYLLVTWLPDYLVTVRHLTILRAGIYSALPFLVFGVSEPIGGWLADHLIRRGWSETLTRKGIITIGFLCGLMLIPAARAASSQVALLEIIGACMVGISTGNLLVVLQCCAPPGEVGIWTGAENFAGNVGGVLAPLVTGLLIAYTRSYFAGFALAAILLVSGLLAYWFIVGDLRPRQVQAGKF